MMSRELYLRSSLFIHVSSLIIHHSSLIFSFMKEILSQYAAFNAWADGQLLAVILNLPEEQQHREIASSFPGLYKTVLHMLDASSIWWQRLKLQERIVRPSEGFTGDMKELAERVLKQDREWVDWINH